MSVNATSSALGLSSALPAGLSMPFTQFCWAKAGTLASSLQMMGVYTAGETHNNSFCIENNIGTWRAKTRTTGDMNVAGAVTDDTWQILISKHQSSTAIAFRVDGTEYTNTGSRTPSGYDILGVARDGSGINRNYNAYLAHYGVVNRDITTGEAQSLEAGGNPIDIFGADLVAYLPANDQATWLYDPVREINWTNGARTYSAENPTVDPPSSSQGVLSLEPLYYGANPLANKTNITWTVRPDTGSGLNNEATGAGVAGTTNGSGVFTPNGDPNLGNPLDNVYLSLYWEEGNPAVDRSLIVKTTLVEAV